MLAATLPRPEQRTLVRLIRRRLYKRDIKILDIRSKDVEPANGDQEKPQIAAAGGAGPLRHSQRARRALTKLNSQAVKTTTAYLKVCHFADVGQHRVGEEYWKPTAPEPVLPAASRLYPSSATSLSGSVLQELSKRPQLQASNSAALRPQVAADARPWHWCVTSCTAEVRHFALIRAPSPLMLTAPLVPHGPRLTSTPFDAAIALKQARQI
jgi:hypothetical protein